MPCSSRDRGSPQGLLLDLSSEVIQSFRVLKGLQEGDQGGPLEKAQRPEGFPRRGPLPVVGQDRLPESGRASVVQHPRLRAQAPERLCSHPLAGGAVLGDAVA